METKKRELKKIGIMFLVILIFSLLFSIGNVYAKKYDSLSSMRADKGKAVKNTIDLKSSHLKDDKNHLFCIQHFQNEGDTYEISNYVSIEGRLATNYKNKTWLDHANSKLAYVIFGSSYGDRI